MSDENATPDDADLSRRKFLTVATAATGAVGAAFTLVPFIASWKPSERARALGAPLEIDVSKLEPGQMITKSWRKQDRKSTRLNSSHVSESRMPSSA